MKITLAATRVNAGFTQKTAAEALEVSENTVCNWENGNTRPSGKNLIKIGEKYKISIDDIFLPSESSLT